MPDIAAPAVVSTGVATPLAGAVPPSRSFNDLGNIGDVSPAFEPAESQPEVQEQPETQTTEQQPETEQPEQEQPGVLTAEQQAAKFQEWMDSDAIPEEFADKVYWHDSDGKGTMVPIRMKDIGNNILMYHDYQRKTTELAQQRREHEGRVNGYMQFKNDLTSGDPKMQQMALRAVGADIRALVIGYVQQEAELEKYPEHMRDRMRDAMHLEERQTLFQRQMQAKQEAEAKAAAEAQQQQGVQAPDVVYVHERLNEMLPGILQQCGVMRSEAFEMVLDGIMAEAAMGVRGANGQWIEPPTIMRGRAPSPQVLQRLVLAAKEKLATLTQQHGRQQNPPRSKPPQSLGGSGPAAKPGTQGNLSQPERKRFSDMGGL